MWPKCARVLLVTRAWLVPEAGQGRFALSLNHPQPSILNVRMKCLLGTTVWNKHTKCQDENSSMPGNWSSQEVRNTWVILKESLNSERRQLMCIKKFFGFSVGFYVAILIPSYEFLQRVSRHISLWLPRYLKKCCVTKNHSYSGACTMGAPGMTAMVGSPTIAQRTR